MSRPLRVGAMPYLLGRPLVRGLELAPPNAVLLRQMVPSELATELRAGNLDAALVPVAAVLSEPGLKVLPGLCVACDGPVQSIRLFHTRPLADLRRVALDRSSRSAALLAKVILACFERAHPTYVEARPDLAAMLRNADAALLIGDPALAAPLDLAPWVDLGTKWRERTGLGFVFAVWAYRDGLESSEVGRLTEVLHESASVGMAQIHEIASEEAGARGLPEEAVRRYLTESILYRPAPSCLDGLDRFIVLAIELGLLPPDARFPPGLRS